MEKVSSISPLFFRFLLSVGSCILASVSSAKVMEHVCANREHRKRATNCGIGVVAIHTDKMHYYLCTLINGESKLSINHVCPRGWETGGADRVDRSEEGKDLSDYSSWPRGSQTKNTNRKLLCKLFMVCKTLVEGCLHQHVWMGHTDRDLYTNK